MSKKPFHYEVKNQASGVPEILVYGYIGTWDDVDYPRFQNLFRDALKSNNKLNVRLHCGGGSVFEGLAIYDLITTSDCETTMIIEGIAASMGGVIALAGDHIIINPNGQFMAHAVKGGVYGTKQDMVNYIDLMDNSRERLAAIFAERTKADKETIDEWLDSGKDFWFSADKCLELGIVDEVVKTTKQRKNQDADNMTGKTPEEAFDSFKLDNEFKIDNNLNQPIEMKKESILAALMSAGLAGNLSASSSDNDFENRLNELFNKAKKTESLENEMQEFKKVQAETLIANALKSGKITNAEKEEWEKDAISNYALVSKSLERMSGKPDLNNGLERPKKKEITNQHELLNGREKWTFNDWQEKDPKGLQKLQEEDNEEFEKLFNAEYN
ncbi:head maturation protease, ClpP-related [Chryseobacterium sp.]|uniref:head maturation protease, ClpP-related n=1 Tax=Chryseobacterium sp. TaxID=1871047 RepID=UPI00289BB221|nr:head maturation protease, ClpP-related [Chryseobacterium sp.]